MLTTSFASSLGLLSALIHFPSDEKSSRSTLPRPGSLMHLSFKACKVQEQDAGARDKVYDSGATINKSLRHALLSSCVCFFYGHRNTFGGTWTTVHPSNEVWNSHLSFSSSFRCHSLEISMWETNSLLSTPLATRGRDVASWGPKDTKQDIARPSE